jgi:hypothetical protein
MINAIMWYASYFHLALFVVTATLVIREAVSNRFRVTQLANRPKAVIQFKPFDR